MSAPGWFDNKLSLGNLITIGVVGAGVIAGWYQFDARLALSEAARAGIEKRLDRIEVDRDDLKVRVIRIEEKLSSQSDKLDRILRSVETGRN